MFGISLANRSIFSYMKYENIGKPFHMKQIHCPDLELNLALLYQT
jgi:hypothetical protein